MAERLDGPLLALVKLVPPLEKNALADLFNADGSMAETDEVLRLAARLILQYEEMKASGWLPQVRRSQKLKQLETKAEALAKQLDAISNELRFSLDVEMRGATLNFRGLNPRPYVPGVSALRFALDRLKTAISQARRDPKRTKENQFGRGVFLQAIWTWRRCHDAWPTIDNWPEESRSARALQTRAKALTPSPLFSAVAACVLQMTEDQDLRDELTDSTYRAALEMVREDWSADDVNKTGKQTHVKNKKR